MPAPSYHLTNYFGTAQPADDVLQLIENELALTEWTFVEAVGFTQSAIARTMRIWKCPATLNAAGTDFYIGLVKNTAPGTYLGIRAFEGWNTTTKLIQRPAIAGAASTLVGSWRSVAYGNGTFVAVSSNTGLAATSSDGITWTSRRMPSTQSWSSVAFGGGQFVAVSNSSTAAAATSPDGITWTTRTLPATTTWTGVAYGGGMWVAIATGGTQAASSPDGITWTSRTLPASQSWQAVTYGNGVFAAVANTAGTASASSTDGLTWTARTITSGTYTNITYGNGTFVASTTTSGAATSPDAVTWTGRTIGVASNGLAFGNGVFLALPSSGSTAYTSPDGITWTARALPGSTLPWYAAGYGGGVFTAIGTGTTITAYSSDAVTFAQGKGIGSLSNASSFTDYALTGATTPLMVDGNVTLSTTTNYDVGILVSKSYLAIGINVNGTGSNVTSWVAGLYQPAFADSQATNPPLMLLTMGSGGNSPTSGVSRATRVPIEEAGGTFSVAGGPESLLLGTHTANAKESVTGSIRASRIALIAGTGTGGYATSGGMRGWLYDCIAVALNNNNVVKIADTATIGATAWVNLGQSGNSVTLAGSFGYFFNPTGGS